ncbi:MAG: 2-hydroxyacyl-CoA dehydratase, partial [Lachnospiraceae bacterium]|nr:2-hydroxyacyl-CoA dehydratase [Lachnospiraceae bacterium]
NINCSVMSPNTGRIDNIRTMIREYRIDGVMELVLTACHTYAIESFLVRDAAEEMNVGYLKIDTDFSKSDTGQIGTRLAAFLETIG